MSSRKGFALAVVLLLIAAALRMLNLPILPLGLHDGEIADIRIAETVRQGDVLVFYTLGTEGREGLYHTALAVTTGATGAGLLGYRMLSVWVGMITLALVYALVRRLYNPLAGVAAMGLMTVGMLPILLSRTVGRETLLPLLTAAVLLALTRAFFNVRQPVHTTPFAALGLLLGLGFYIHPLNFMITLAAMLFIAYMVLSRQPLSRRKLGYIGFAIVLMIVAVVPYLISSIRLPELSGTERVFNNFGDARPLRSLLNGLGGFFLVGDHNPVINLPLRPMIDLVSGVLMYIGVLVALRYWRQPRFVLPLIISLVLIPVTLVQASSPNFFRMSALLPLVSVFFGIGVSTIYHTLQPRVRPVIYLALLALLVGNVAWVVRDLFIVWPQREDVQTAYNTPIGQLAHYLDLTSGQIPSVICVSTEPVDTGYTELSAYQLLSLMMHHQNATIRYADCGSSIVLTEGGEREQVIFPEASAFFDTHAYIRRWLRYGTLSQNADLPPRSVVDLNVSRPLADTVGRFTTTAPVFFAPEAPGGMELTYPPVRFGGNLTFLGYEPISDTIYQPNDYITLISYWRVDGALPPDLRLFTHVLLDPTTPAAQSHNTVLLPTELEPRDIFIQITFVRLPQSMPGGQYWVSVGAYRQNTDTRLDVFDGEVPRGVRLFLDEITVEAGQ